jgi:hypothetical protein
MGIHTADALGQSPSTILETEHLRGMPRGNKHDKREENEGERLATAMDQISSELLEDQPLYTITIPVVQIPSQKRSSMRPRSALFIRISHPRAS